MDKQAFTQPAHYKAESEARYTKENKLKKEKKTAVLFHLTILYISNVHV